MPWRIFKRDDGEHTDSWLELRPLDPPEGTIGGYIYKPTAASHIGAAYGAGRYLVLGENDWEEIEIRAEPRFVLVEEEAEDDSLAPA